VKQGYTINRILFNVQPCVTITINWTEQSQINITAEAHACWSSGLAALVMDAQELQQPSSMLVMDAQELQQPSSMLVMDAQGLLHLALSILLQHTNLPLRRYIDFSIFCYFARQSVVCPWFMCKI